MSEVFTPLNAEQTARLTFPIEDVTVVDGNLNVRTWGKKAVVRIANVEYAVFGIPCGLESCDCDAYIKPLEQARVCSICTREVLTEGYYCCDEYFCSRACLDSNFDATDETWESHYTEDGDCYFTVWEGEAVSA